MLQLNAQGKKATRNFNAADTALIQSFINKGTEHASVNNDSALYYAEISEKAAKEIKNDPLVASAFFLKAKIYYFMSNFSAAQFYQYKCLLLAEKTNDKNLMSKAYNLAGAICFSIGNYSEAIKQYNNRLIISQQEKDTNGILQGYFNISLVYNTKGEYRKAVEVNYKALELAEKTKDTINLMAVYEGLGSSYYELDDTERAVSFLNKAYRFSIVKKEEYEQAGILIDIGNIYQKEKEYYRSIYYYNKAIELTNKNGDKRRLSIATSNKAKSLVAVKQRETALVLYNNALKINLEINYTKGVSDVLANKAECLMEMEKYSEAEKLAIQARDIAIKINAPKEEYACYTLLEKIYLGLNNTEKAYQNYKLFVALHNSVEDNAQIKTISGIEFSYEKEKTIREQKFKDAEAAAEVKKQKQIRNIILIGGIAMLILLIFILRIYFQTRKANNEIDKQNKTIEEKNESILNSINYSKGIQEAILTPAEEIKKLLPESFVLYKPKDIVSGDFYFIEPIMTSGTQIAAVALADCTGHGVPGALMSLMGYNILKQSLLTKEVNNPGEALDYLNKELHSLLRQNQKEKHILDGMDIAFCSIDFMKQKIMFAGANNPLWLVSKRKNITDILGNQLKLNSELNGNYLYEIKATKQPIGFTESPKLFITHNIQLEKGDLIYLFTDGFADQFGGPKGKKYKYKPLSEIILKSADLNLAEQKKILENSFTSWKGNLEQVDDVSIMGIRM